MTSALSLLAQAATRTVDPPAKQPLGLFLPVVAIVAVVALIVAVAAFLRARRSDA